MDPCGYISIRQSQQPNPSLSSWCRFSIFHQTWRRAVPPSGRLLLPDLRYHPSKTSGLISIACKPNRVRHGSPAKRKKESKFLPQGARWPLISIPPRIPTTSCSPSSFPPTQTNQNTHPVFLRPCLGHSAGAVRMPASDHPICCVLLRSHSSVQRLSDPRPKGRLLRLAPSNAVPRSAPVSHPLVAPKSQGKEACHSLVPSGSGLSSQRSPFVFSRILLSPILRTLSALRSKTKSPPPFPPTGRSGCAILESPPSSELKSSHR